MRVAALYDIHGNLPALEAVLQEVRDLGVEELVVGGDVYPGPLANECLAALLDLDVATRFIQGNGDREVLELAAGGSADAVPAAYRDAMRWAAERLGPDLRRAMSGWPATVAMEIEGLGEALFCHATPRSDTEIFTAMTPDERLVEPLAGCDAGLVICGHTHMQFDRRVGTRRVVNAGSVGMPFGEPGAYWLLLGREVRLRRTEYDLEAAAERVRASGYPQAESFAADNIVSPPAAKTMLQAFEAAASKLDDQRM